MPNLTRAVREGTSLVIGVGFLMADAVAQARSGSRRRSSRSSTTAASRPSSKGKPTNVRGLTFKENEAGYLVGCLAALAAKNGRTAPA